MSINSKMTAIASKIRGLLGISEVMSMDAMAQNLDRVQSEVDSQAALLNYAIDAIQNKAAGGNSGGVVRPLTVTPSEEKQTFTPNGFDGYAPVIIEAIPDSYVQPSGTKSITINGTHDVSSFASVNVNVPTQGGSGDFGDVAVVEPAESGEAIFYFTSSFSDRYVVYGDFSEDTLFRAGSRVYIIVPKSEFGE